MKPWLNNHLDSLSEVRLTSRVAFYRIGSSGVIIGWKRYFSRQEWDWRIPIDILGVSQLHRNLLLNHVETLYSWGIGVMLGIYVAGDSGGFLNPAITFCFCLYRGLPWRRFPVYLVAQFLGGFCAAGVIYGNYVSLETAITLP